MTKEIIVDEEKEKEIVEQDQQQEIQQKVLTYRILHTHLEQIQREAEIIERKYMEIEATKQFIDDLKKSKDGSEILLPVGTGIFARGKLTDKKLLTDIGAGIMTKKTVKDIELMVEGQRAEIEATVKKLNREMRETVQKLNVLTPEIQKLQQGS